MDFMNPLLQFPIIWWCLRMNNDSGGDRTSYPLGGFAQLTLPYVSREMSLDQTYHPWQIVRPNSDKFFSSFELTACFMTRILHPDFTSALLASFVGSSNSTISLEMRIVRLWIVRTTPPSPLFPFSLFLRLLIRDAR